MVFGSLPGALFGLPTCWCPESGLEGNLDPSRLSFFLPSGCIDFDLVTSVSEPSSSKKMIGGGCLVEAAFLYT